MLVLGIGGSPRIGGNTDILLDRALEGARAAGSRIEKVVLNTLDFAPCQECENLASDGSCVVRDDFQGLYARVIGAAAVILASPIFFGSLSAQTKMMVDRFQCLWRAKYLLGLKTVPRRRPGVFIAAEASKRKDFFENARAIVRNWFATIEVDYRGELLVEGVEEKGAVLGREDALRNAGELGRMLAEVSGGSEG